MNRTLCNRREENVEGTPPPLAWALLSRHDTESTGDRDKNINWTLSKFRSLLCIQRTQSKECTGNLRSGGKYSKHIYLTGVNIRAYKRLQKLNSEKTLSNGQRTGIGISPRRRHADGANEEMLNIPDHEKQKQKPQEV